MLLGIMLMFVIISWTIFTPSFLSRPQFSDSDLPPVQELPTKPEMFYVSHPASNGPVRGTFHFPIGHESHFFFTLGLPQELNPITLWQELGLPADIRLYFDFSPMLLCNWPARSMSDVLD
jgi:hypothetical protein